MSSINIYFPLITATELKALISDINDNISDDYIETTLKQQQVKNIRPLLGYSLYNEIQTQLSGSSFSTANEFLYDEYIQIILAYLIYKKLVVSLTYQLNNDGLRKRFSSTSEISDTKGIDLVRSGIQDDIDYYKSEMIKYICENQSDYPLYITDTDDRYNSLDDKRTRGPEFGINIGTI